MWNRTFCYLTVQRPNPHFCLPSAQSCCQYFKSLPQAPCPGNSSLGPEITPPCAVSLSGKCKATQTFYKSQLDLLHLFRIGTTPNWWLGTDVGRTFLVARGHPVLDLPVLKLQTSTPSGQTCVLWTFPPKHPGPCSLFKMCSSAGIWFYENENNRAWFLTLQGKKCANLPWECLKKVRERQRKKARREIRSMFTVLLVPFRHKLYNRISGLPCASGEAPWVQFPAGEHMGDHTETWPLV